MTTTKPETGIYFDNAHGAFHHAEAEALAAGMSRGAAMDAGAAAQQAYLDWQASNEQGAKVASNTCTAEQRAYLDYVSQVGLPALTADKVRKLQRVRAVLAELAEAEDCDGETSGALLLARADVGDVLAGCVHLRGTAGDDDDDDDTAELAAAACERR